MATNPSRRSQVRGAPVTTLEIVCTGVSYTGMLASAERFGWARSNAVSTGALRRRPNRDGYGASSSDRYFGASAAAFDANAERSVALSGGGAVVRSSTGTPTSMKNSS